MLKDITLGQYFPGNSIAHKLDPRTKILLVTLYIIALFCAKSIVTYALLALSVDLIWGYMGVLSLGHGAFFALGGYAFGMYLMRQIGARGLRAIMEEIMTKIMYEIPSDPTIQSVCITERCVREGEPPQITRDAAKPRAPIKNAGVTL